MFKPHLNKNSSIRNMYHYDTCLLVHSFLTFRRLDILEGAFPYLCYLFLLKQIISLCNLCVYCIAIRCYSATINLNNCSIFLLVIKILTISCLTYKQLKSKVEMMPQCLCPQNTSYIIPFHQMHIRINNYNYRF